MQEELKVEVGEEVLYLPAAYTKIEKIAVVTKITPTGRIKINKSKKTFNKYGIATGDSIWSGSDFIYKLTPEKKQELIQESIIKLCITKFDKCKDDLSFEQANKILEILRNEKYDAEE